MEPGKQLDAAGGPGRGRLIFLLFFSLLLAVVPVHAQAQNSAPSAENRDEQFARAKALYDAGRWQDLIDAFPESPGYSPQLELYRGLAFAQLGRLAEARGSFRGGLARDPRQPRLLEELAGVEYKQTAILARQTATCAEP